MVDEDEMRYEWLVNALNGNLDYLKNTVLARKGETERKSLAGSQQTSDGV